MKSKPLIFAAITALFVCFESFTIKAELVLAAEFNIKKDLLLVNFDCKTDVDDIHTAAALITLMSHSKFEKVNYHAVAGTYGIQEGLYVPPNDLFQLAFEDNWSDADANSNKALEQVMKKVKKTLNKNGDIWIAEAGQSDFTAKLVKAIQAELPKIDVSTRVHVVQHSDWNEKVTSPESLKFVQATTDYQKIPDGNAVGNGSPGFRIPEYTAWESEIKDPKLLGIWEMAVEIGLAYNGKDGRYNNEAVASGGLDFSDLSEVCWIFGIQNIKDAPQFFDEYGQ
ncbi:hypothetical protein [Algoriphagus chordae]|uniref:DUF1593 domain-containing protein n=1 Tax=Algoriphagus chordae TaxID=237019 RepID=A0A2W7QV22_9BACT|nr:hypothetical protein [Algoriphagus chordae]PZX51046.1 hypothetical protein LV85_02589 [Algoriphagus chordae]